MEILETFEERLTQETIPRKLTDNTIRTYKAGLNKILVLFDNDYSMKFITNPEATIRKLESQYSSNDNTLVGKINIIMKVIKVMYPDNKKYEDYYNQYKIYRELLSGNIKSQYETHEPSTAQLEKHTTQTEDLKIETELTKQVKRSIITPHDIVGLRNLIIYKFLQLQNCRGDFILSKLVIHKCNNVYDDLTNYIVINKKFKNIQFIENEYKTKSKHGKVIHTIDNELLYKLFNKLFNAYKKLNIEGDNAFYNEDLKTAMTPHNLSVLYTRFGTKYLNKKISIQVLRVEQHSNTVNIEELLALSKKQGHTLQTAISQYSKKNFKKQ